MSTRRSREPRQNATVRSLFFKEALGVGKWREGQPDLEDAGWQKSPIRQI